MKRILAAGVATLLTFAGCGASDDAASQSSDSSTGTEVNSAQSEGATAAGQRDDGAEAPVSVLAFVDVAAEGALTAEIESGAPQPAAPEIEVVTTGSGRKVSTDGVALVSYIAVDWDGAILHRSNEIDDRLSVVIGNPEDSPPDAVSMPEEIEQAMIGLSVGTRLTVALPVGTTGMPKALRAGNAHLVVLDIVAFQTPEES